MNKVKIMYLLFSFTTGGMERLVADLCNEMVKKKYTVYLCVINDVYTQQVIDTIDKDVKVLLLNRHPGKESRIKLLFDIEKIIRKEKIDIVHCNGMNTVECTVITKIFNPRVKIIYTTHDVGQYKFISKKNIILKNILCNKLIAISECVKKEMLEFGADEKKVITVYNGINFNKFSIKNRKDFDSNKVIIGNVARLLPEKKGQDLLIYAISRLKNRYPGILCYFAGDVAFENNNFLLELQELTKKLNVQDNIIFLGNVENVQKFLTNIDLFILPSRYEGFGISLIEALAMGIPCIASNLDGPSEIIKDEKYGLLFEAGNAQSLVNKIEYMLDNIEYFISQKEQNIAYIKSQFDISSMCDRLERIYLDK